MNKISMKIKKIDVVFIIILIILVIISIDLLLVEEHRDLITNIWGPESFESEQLIARLVIVFVVCMIGNLLPVPTPYSWAVCLGYAYIIVNPALPLLFGIIAALGCLVGEMGGYLVGRGAAEIISDERAEKLSKYQDYLTRHPKLAPFLIFLFGLTPLNDDMLTIPLGLIKYSVKKTIIWMWLGKLGMMLLFAYNLLGICGLIGGDNWVISIASLFLIVILIYVMIRIDFVKKLREREEKKNLERGNQ